MAMTCSSTSLGHINITDSAVSSVSDSATSLSDVTSASVGDSTATTYFTNMFASIVKNIAKLSKNDDIDFAYFNNTLSKNDLSRLLEQSVLAVIPTIPEYIKHIQANNIENVNLKLGLEKLKIERMNVVGELKAKQETINIETYNTKLAYEKLCLDKDRLDLEKDKINAEIENLNRDIALAKAKVAELKARVEFDTNKTIADDNTSFYDLVTEPGKPSSNIGYYLVKAKEIENDLQQNQHTISNMTVIEKETDLLKNSGVVFKIPSALSKDSVSGVAPYFHSITKQFNDSTNSMNGYFFSSMPKTHKEVLKYVEIDRIYDSTIASSNINSEKAKKIYEATIAEKTAAGFEADIHYKFARINADLAIAGSKNDSDKIIATSEKDKAEKVAMLQAKASVAVSINNASGQVNAAAKLT